MQLNANIFETEMMGIILQLNANIFETEIMGIISKQLNINYIYININMILQYNHT